MPFDVAAVWYCPDAHIETSTHETGTVYTWFQFLPKLEETQITVPPTAVWNCPDADTDTEVKSAFRLFTQVLP